jgi:DNA repair exonuclease SbcCD ATPase subunit
MKINHLSVSHFAGIQAFQCQFGEHLTVVYGENEKGKSTLLKALKFALFIPSNIGARALMTQFGFKLEDILPRNGESDTFQVGLHFEYEGKKYALKKSFGAAPFSELVNETDGGNIQQPATVQARLNEMLEQGGANLAAWLKVMFANQASLTRSLAEIREESSISNSLADILTQFEGKSPEQFKQDLDEKLKALTANWELFDRNGMPYNRPRMNGAQGDVDHPWVNGNGFIISAYYNKKKEIIKRQSRADFEQLFDAKVSEITEMQDQQERSRAFTEQHKAVLTGNSNRSALEANLRLIEKQKSDATSAFTDWTNATTFLDALQTHELTAKRALKELEEEMNSANQVAGAETLKQDVAYLTDIQAKMDEKSKELIQLKEISQEDYREADRLSKALDKLRIKLEAQKLRVELVAKQLVNAKLKKGLDGSESIQIQSGETFSFEANTQFVLELNEFQLSTTAGNEKVADIEASFQRDETALQQLLEKYGVTDFQAMNTLQSAHQKIKVEIQGLESNYAGRLGGRNIEELSLEYAKIQGIQVRPKAVLSPLIQSQSQELVRLEMKRDQFKKRLDELENQFVNQEGIMSEMIRLSSEIEKYKKDLASLPQLPEGYEDFASFKISYDDHVNSLQKANDRLFVLLQERSGMLSRYSDEASLEEINEQVRIYEAQYQAYIEQAMAYHTIAKRLEVVQAEVAENPYAALTLKVNSYLGSLTSGRYVQVDMDRAAPVGLLRDGYTLETHLLSQGTSDVLALALRLGMADVYQGDFLVLDDPMTELDEGRQVNASNVLRAFSADKQVIVFTCHARNRDLLGGEVIHLGE